MFLHNIYSSSLSGIFGIHIEPVGSVSPKITAGDDTKKVKVPMNTSTALLCQCQSFPVSIFRCLENFSATLYFSIFRFLITKFRNVVVVVVFNVIGICYKQQVALSQCSDSVQGKLTFSTVIFFPFCLNRN